MFDSIKPNVLLAILAAVVVAVFGGDALIRADQPEYAAGLYGIVLTAIAASLKTLTNPSTPTVPTSVVMHLMGAPAATGDVKVNLRINALFCLAVVAVISLAGGFATINAGATELGYAIFGLGIGAASTALIDLIRPADEGEVPLRVVELLQERLGKPR